jgi:hypothetical protein
MSAYPIHMHACYHASVVYAQGACPNNTVIVAIVVVRQVISNTSRISSALYALLQSEGSWPTSGTKTNAKY